MCVKREKKKNKTEKKKEEKRSKEYGGNSPLAVLNFADPGLLKPIALCAFNSTL